ncbi:MAG: energy transducer TonB [Bacteroidales bacterium]
MKTFLLLGAFLFSATAIAGVSEDEAHSILDLKSRYVKEIKSFTKDSESTLNNQEGRTWTSFTVLPDGGIRNIRIESSTNPLLNQKALDIVSSLPNMKMDFIKDSIRVLLPVDMYKKKDFYTRNNLCFPIVRKLETLYPAGEFPGGNDAFACYLYDNVKRSVLKHVKNERYYINLDFRIDKQGKATKIKFITEMKNPELKSEIKRLINNMPAWENTDQLTDENNRRIAMITLGPDDKDLKKVMLNSSYENYFELITPEYPGGLNALMNFLMSETKYPKEAYHKKIYGKVISKIYLDEEGRIIDKKVVKEVHPLLDKEALRVISKLPQFSPATLDGKPVRFVLTLPINFRFPAP